MSAKANPTVVGLFVVLGLLIGVAGLLLLGSSRLFTSTYDYILYFDDSLNGLNEGAPVKFRGVTIGQVKKVMINYNQATNDYAMPVLIEVRLDLIKGRVSRQYRLDDPKQLEGSIQRGLRGMLAAESLVTGVLYVELEPLRNAPTPVFHQLEKTYIEIPTQPTDTQQLLKNLAQLDLKSLQDHLNQLIATIDNKAGELRAAEISQGITNLVEALHSVVRSRDLTNSLSNLSAMLAEYRGVGVQLQQRVPAIGDNLSNSLAQVNATLARFNGAADDLRSFVGPDAALRHDLTVALAQIAAAAQSLADLADFLHRHPNALITGRENGPRASSAAGTSK
jgi:paraquat-inducible protein B